MSHELRLQLCSGPDEDDREYFAQLAVVTDTESHPWAEIHLENVAESEEGLRRVESARAVVRIWSDNSYFDIGYQDAVAVLERARTLLLIGESHVPPA